MNDAKEEIRARLPVEDVVSQYIELKRAGRTLKGRSPWGVDKTPSFMVSPEKGIWHDFSANKGGDIFSFVMEVEGITFREALEKLAAQAGVELTKYSGGDAKMAKKKARAKEALELSTKYYQWCLTKSKMVCEYVFYKRNLNKGTLQEFRIGYAPAQGKMLTKFLTQKGFTKVEMADAGLLNRFDGDMFRGRMTVPFIDTNGSVIGFTARVIGKGEPKYLNTPETILFNKGRFIFGLFQAKEAIRKNGFVVIVEGNMDVISSHQAGVKEAVATSGTAMTEMHLKTLARLTDDIRLAYDGDDAGVNATERAIKMASELGIKLTVISDYHGAKDPDELIQKSPELWREAVKNSKPAVDWILERYEEKLDLATAEGKQEFSNKAMEVIRGLPGVMQKHYKQQVAKRLDVEIEDLEKTVKSENKAGVFLEKRLKKVKTEAPKNEALKKIENNLLALMVYGGVSGERVEIEIPEDEMKLKELELVFEKEYGGWDKTALEKEVAALEKRRKVEKNKAEIEALSAKLEEADEVESKKILEKIMALRKG
ncbi:DNA primase [Candidatus Saccharibacteria bacterium]|nr:DNA primase [Candidatus Saccharibacteria bacterium]